MGLLAGLLLIGSAASAGESGCFNMTYGYLSSNDACEFSTTGTHWIDLDVKKTFSVCVQDTITATNAAIEVELYDCMEGATVHTDTRCSLLRTTSQTSLTGIYPADEWENLRAERLLVRVVTHSGGAQTSRIRLAPEQ
jgi:hypothetical protein